MPITICDDKYNESVFHPGTTGVLGLKYRLDGRTVAVIFHYTHADHGPTRSIRMLLINNVTHRAPIYPSREGLEN